MDIFSGEESKACRRVVGSETSLSAHICSRGNDRYVEGAG